METEEFVIGGNRIKMTTEDIQYILDLPSEGDEIHGQEEKQPTELFGEYIEPGKTTIQFSGLTEFFTKNNRDDIEFI
uniref:Uncharacterized protein n=1 Tax=Arundo donax TaxID=35708 RepID=A0A0A9F3C5_ARUDO